MTSSITVTANFDVAGNFTFDANLVEISGAVARLKQNPNLTFAASYRTTGKLDADFALGSVTATPIGVDTLTWNGADFRNLALGNRVDYRSAVASAMVQAGTIRIEYVPNYAGTPSAARDLILIGASFADINKNQIAIFHDNAGNILVRMKDSTGVQIINVSFGAFVAVRNTKVEIEYNFDLTAGANRLFVDGVQLGATDTTTGTRTAVTGFVGIGPQSSPGDFAVEEFALFRAVEHTGGYTPGALDPNDPDIVFGARYREFSLDADIGQGRTATVLGVVRVIHGVDLEGGTGAGAHRIDYDDDLNVDGIVQQGCFRYTAIPNYTGSYPGPSTQAFFNITRSATQNDNEIFVGHQTDGSINVIIRSDTGSIFSGTLGSWAAVAGQPAQHELNFDINTGIIRYFIDGTLVGSTTGATGVRKSNRIGAFRIGDAIITPTDTADLFLRDFGAFSTVQHTADYDAAKAGLLFSSGDPTIKIFAAFDADAFLSFAAVVTAALPDEVRFTMEVNGVEQWFDGAAWTTSDKTLDETNTAAEINASVAALDLSAGARIRPVVYLHSEDGVTTPGPTIASHTFGIDFFSFAEDQPDVRECVVFGFEIDNEGNPEVGKTVRAINKSFKHNSHFVQPTESVTTTDSNGRWELQVVETASIDANLRPYRFVVGAVSHEDIAIPDQVSVVFNTLLP